MTYEEIKAIVSNPDSSDQEVFEALKEWANDEYEDSGHIVPPGDNFLVKCEELRPIALQFHPKAMDMLTEYFFSMFGGPDVCIDVQESD